MRTNNSYLRSWGQHMKNPKEQYRNALRFQIKKNGTDVKSLAEKVGCTPRHIQGFLSEKEKKGMGAEFRAGNR